MKHLLLMLGFVVLGLFTFNACQKDETVVEESFVQATEDVATVEDFSEQVDLDIDVDVEERGGNSGSGCPTITFAQPQGTWPNTITIDYGSACTRPDGRVLKGKIIINQSADLFTPGATRTVTHENFFVDDVQVLGVKTWTNNGVDNIGQFSFSKVAQGMQLIYADGTSVSWNTSRTNTLVEGNNTTTHLDNVWSIVGTTSGKNRNGETFSVTTTEPMIKKAGCRWINEGLLNLTRENRTATLDFGNGVCDRWGTLTIDNGTVITIRLRR
ncbi:MAG: hypothetical protein ACOYNO_09075 [Saprospiraceae bacterium]